VEEGSDAIGVEVLEAQSIWRAPDPLARESEEELQRVAIGEDRVRAEVALSGEVALKEVLDSTGE
jgi:hypothetical protein